MADTMMIRTAREEDIPRVMEMAHCFFPVLEARHGRTQNPEVVLNLTRRLISGHTADASVLLVAENGTGIVGMIGALVYVDPLTGERGAGQVVWWVTPTSRSRRLGLTLLRRAEAWAKEQGAVSMQLASWSGPRDCYRKLGYKRTEIAYTKAL